MNPHDIKAGQRFAYGRNGKWIVDVALCDLSEAHCKRNGSFRIVEPSDFSHLEVGDILTSILTGDEFIVKEAWRDDKELHRATVVANLRTKVQSHVPADTNVLFALVGKVPAKGTFSNPWPDSVSREEPEEGDWIEVASRMERYAWRPDDSKPMVVKKDGTRMWRNGTALPPNVFTTDIDGGGESEEWAHGF